MLKIDCLDKGYVRLVDSMGSDLSIVNAARVSFEKESTQLTPKDERLIHFLVEHGHTSPFRHATLEFEIRAPLMVARQWFKYRVGSHHMEDANVDDSGFNDPLYARNESSRRYVTEEPEFYSDVQWLEAPENRKQGSGMPLDTDAMEKWSTILSLHQSMGKQWYEAAIKAGICPEQARLFLPAYGLYIRWRWTCSLLAVVHFLNQRLHHDAQSEIRQYANGVYELVRQVFPVSIRELTQPPDST
jgi:thymidylate synthase (FAD)